MSLRIDTENLAIRIATEFKSVRSALTAKAPQNQPVRSTAAPSITAVAGELLLVNAAGGARTVAPPGSPSDGCRVIVVKTDNSLNEVLWSGATNADTSAGLVTPWAGAEFTWSATLAVWVVTAVNVTGGAVASVNGRTGAVTGLAEAASLAAVATTGSYNDLSDKPASGGGSGGVAAARAAGLALILGS